MRDWSISTRRKLLAWYRRRKRDLPWRRTRDPYAIWVSEVMLQQTRVVAVVPYYTRFLERFPDVGTLARARIDSVLALWSGLGYYRRARFLHAAAKEVARRGLPVTSAEWRALPGVGAYTAAAVASIAFGEAAAVVDGNVERVLCRLHALRERDKRNLRDLATAWLSRRSPGNHNQAVMELGATVCVPRAPDCPRCPLREECRGKETPERFPAPRPRVRPRIVEQAVSFAERDGRVLLQRREGRGLLEGMWELPGSRRNGAPLATVKHAILDRRILLRIYSGSGDRRGRWFTPAQASRLPLAAATRKCLSRVGFFDAQLA